MSRELLISRLLDKHVPERRGPFRMGRNDSEMYIQWVCGLGVFVREKQFPYSIVQGIV